MLPIAGDGQDLWLIVPAKDKKQIAIFHRKRMDKPYTLRRVPKLNGGVPANGAATAGGTLWLVYDGMTVQSLRMAKADERLQSLYEMPSTAGALPKKAQLLGLAADETGPWALIQVGDAKVLEELDKPDSKTKQEPKQNGKPQLSASEPADTPDQDTTTVDVESNGNTETTHADRLLHQERGKWVKYALPNDWSESQRAWLLMRKSSALPTVIVPAGDKALAVYHHAKETWHRTDYAVPNAQSAELAFAIVDHQLVMGRHKQGDAGELMIQLSLLRDGQASEIGDLVIEKPTTPNWAFASLGQEAALFNFDAAGSPSMTVMGLAGDRSTQGMPLTIEHPPPFVHDADRVLIVCALTLAILLMFSVWRREPTWNKLDLPEQLMLADMMRRAGAAMIDLAPAILLASLISGISMKQMYNHWPGTSGSWAALKPGAIAIAIFVLHTGLSEMFTGKSLGKMLMGLRVTTLDGKAPNIWQFFARNFLKILDLIAWYVLPVLALVGPNRQRLGDLIARTVVVMDRVEEDEDDQSDDAPFD